MTKSKVSHNSLIPLAALIAILVLAVVYGSLTGPSPSKIDDAARALSAQTGIDEEEAKAIVGNAFSFRRSTRSTPTYYSCSDKEWPDNVNLKGLVGYSASGGSKWFNNYWDYCKSTTEVVQYSCHLNGVRTNYCSVKSGYGACGYSMSPPYTCPYGCSDGKCNAAPVCGNGVKEGTEQCDDGNTVNADACSNSCITQIVVAQSSNPAQATSFTVPAAVGTTPLVIGSRVFTLGINQIFPSSASVYIESGGRVSFNGNIGLRDGLELFPLEYYYQGFAAGTTLYINYDDYNSGLLKWRFRYSVAACGNGIREGSESCDDGNSVDTDGCTNLCMLSPSTNLTSTNLTNSTTNTSLHIQVFAVGPLYNGTYPNVGNNSGLFNSTSNSTKVADCIGNSPVTCSGTFQPITNSWDKFYYSFGAEEFDRRASIQRIEVYPAGSSWNPSYGKKLCGGAASACSLNILPYGPTGSPYLHQITVYATRNATPSVCGNGVVEGIEECDDGNSADFDGCDNYCAKNLNLLLQWYGPTANETQALWNFNNSVRNSSFVLRHSTPNASQNYGTTRTECTGFGGAFPYVSCSAFLQINDSRIFNSQPPYDEVFMFNATVLGWTSPTPPRIDVRLFQGFPGTPFGSALFTCRNQQSPSCWWMMNAWFTSGGPREYVLEASVRKGP